MLLLEIYVLQHVLSAVLDTSYGPYEIFPEPVDVFVVSCKANLLLYIHHSFNSVLYFYLTVLDNTFINVEILVGIK